MNVQKKIMERKHALNALQADETAPTTIPSLMQHGDISLEKVRFVSLYCIIILQCMVQKNIKFTV